MNRAIRTLSDTQNLLMSNSDPSLEKKKKKFCQPFLVELLEVTMAVFKFQMEVTLRIAFLW